MMEAFKQLEDVISGFEKGCFPINMKDPRMSKLCLLHPRQRQQVFKLIANTPGYTVAVHIQEGQNHIVPAHVFDWDEFWKITYDDFEYVEIFINQK